MAKISLSEEKWAVEQVNGGRSALDVSKELGTSERTVKNAVSRWKKATLLAATPAAAPGKKSPPPPKSEEKPAAAAESKVEEKKPTDAKKVEEDY